MKKTIKVWLFFVIPFLRITFETSQPPDNTATSLNGTFSDEQDR